MAKAKQAVLVTMKVPQSAATNLLENLSPQTINESFELDHDYAPVPMNATGNLRSFLSESETIVTVRGFLPEEEMEKVKSNPNVLRVDIDATIAPFTPFVCPLEPCDCTPGTPKGNVEDVVKYLEADKIWMKGIKGSGVVVGVVDGGITAHDRPVRQFEEPKIHGVIGGFPSENWGTTASAWGEHGNMCATDVQSIAPEAKIYDIRISDGGDAESTISHALSGFQWALDRHKENGMPHILTNSWGIYQKSWDPVYATDPSHPFTMKVVEAMNEGIVVLFAAGNCGQKCAKRLRCGSDRGPGRSIWGANGHPKVMTVGAVNIRGEWAGYSSQGPAALDPRKPDFCSITHFRGYFDSDSGTSAACPVAAGVVALLKQLDNSLDQEKLRSVLIRTARDIGPPGWDEHSGSGIIQPKAAYDNLSG